MELKYLKEVKRIFSNYSTENESLINEVAKNEYDYELLLNAFEIELISNIGGNNSLQSIEFILKYYLMELAECFNIIDYSIDDKEPLNDFEKYTQCCNKYLTEAFQHIEVTAYNWKISINRLIHEIGYGGINVLQTGLALKLDESELLNKSNEPIEPDNTSEDIELLKRADLKICLLYDLGVIECLQKKNYSNNNIAVIIDYLTNHKVTRNSANATIHRINDTDLIDRNRAYIESIKMSLKLIKSK